MIQGRIDNNEPRWLCSKRISSSGVWYRTQYINLELCQPSPGPEVLTQLVDRFLMEVLPAIQRGTDLVNWKGREPEHAFERSPEDRFDCFIGEGNVGFPGGNLEPFRVKVDCRFDDFSERSAIRYSVGTVSEGALPDWLPFKVVGRSFSISWTKVFVCLERFRPTLISGLLDLMPEVADVLSIDANGEQVRVHLVCLLEKNGSILQDVPVLARYIRDLLSSLHQDADSLLTSR